jgi:hypothetical protein
MSKGFGEYAFGRREDDLLDELPLKIEGGAIDMDDVLTILNLAKGVPRINPDQPGVAEVRGMVRQALAQLGVNDEELNAAGL